MTDVPDTSPSNGKPRALKQGDAFVLVAIAGADIRAIERVIGEVPMGQGMAFVVFLRASDLSAEQIEEHLRAATSMEVLQTRDGLAAQPDHVYVATPGHLVTCTDGALRVVRADERDALPIDTFLRCLAEHFAERSAVVLLAGVTGDGAVGAAELKAAGSLVLVQAPANAAEASLPEQQLLAKAADLVLPLPSLANGLLHYFQAPQPDAEEVASALAADELHPILKLLLQTTGHDFSRYKRSTVRRRIQRRLRVYGFSTAAQYVELLKSLPVESELLFNEMLIGVTSFFRDPLSFQVLEKALLEHLERLPASQDVRVWVPACSTGEEAYSIAILLNECIQRTNKPRSIKVFATDVDPKAIDFARYGRYPRGIAAHVSPQRLERFFVQEDETYRINKETREGIVFAPHNVTRDPPFTHIDLLSCRNLLIYLEPELQQQVLSVFEYALKPGGLLLLGSSESLGPLQSAFDPVDKRTKVFVHRLTQRRRTYALPIDPILSGRLGRREERPLTPVGVRQSSIGATEQVLLSEFVPPSAVIAPSGEIAYIHGRTGRFLEPPIGEPSTNVFDMAREGLRLELPAAVRSAHHTQQPVIRRGLMVRTNGGFEPVTLTVKPLKEPDTVRGLLLVSFQVEEHASENAAPTPSDQTSSLESELQYVRSTLQGMIEDLESSNEELKSMNEELQSTNEEVQSSNEELSTSREELQSLNEELQTLNEELAQRNSLLSQSNDDMHNLLSSVHVATVFVDSQLNIKRFTAPAKSVFRLRDSDVGWPVSDLVVNLDYESLVEDAQEVLRTLAFAEREVQTSEGEWRLMRILPYRTANNMIDGLIITVTDIERMKTAQRESEVTHALFSDLFANLPVPLVLLDEDLQILAASVGFVAWFGTSEADLAGKSLFALGPGWRHAQVRERLEALARGEPCPMFRLQGSLGGSVRGDVLVQPRRLRSTHDRARFLLTFQEVPGQLPPPIQVD